MILATTLLLGAIVAGGVMLLSAEEDSEAADGGECVLETILSGLKADPLLEEGYVPETVETASFAMGCFWGPDGLFGVLPGVIRTRVGYAGGTKENPSYYNLGDHAETIQIDYDPSIISYKELLALFWANHSPFSRAPSTQYRSLVLVHSEAQREAVQALIDRETAREGVRPLTEIVPMEVFTRAEAYHQKYRLQTAIRMQPVVEELQSKVKSFDGFVDSTAAARLNGYLAGWVTRERTEREIERLGLSQESKTLILGALS